MVAVCRIFGLLGLATIASAQMAPIRDGSFELGAFGGVSTGIGKGSAMGGGNVSYAVTNVVLPYVEYSYFPKITLSPSYIINGSSNPLTGNISEHASDFHGGVHLRFQIKESKFAPYAALGVGAMTVGSGPLTNATYRDVNGVHPVPASITLISPGGTNVAVNFGGGLRYYVTPKYGFRVEMKGYKPFGTQSNTTLSAKFNTFLKAEVGVFLQLR
jgi:hypothetical protein